MAVESTNLMDIVQDEAVDAMTQEFEALEELASSSGSEKLSAEYRKLVGNDRLDDIAITIKEKCMYKLVRMSIAEKSADDGSYADIVQLLKEFNDFFSAIPKAKTAKIVRNILDIVSKVPGSLKRQIKLCQDVVEWCKQEKRTFLRQRIEAKLAALLVEDGGASEALKLVNSLLVELKKLDDKQMLTEVHLTEARTYYEMRNTPKAKASLTASRTAANSIYVVPLLQAEIDEMSGTLQTEEGDSTTAFSYFLEAFEGYDQAGHARAISVLKYMILCKILGGLTSDVPNMLAGKQGLKYSGPDLDAMGAVCDAARDRSLDDFKAAIQKHSANLKTDILISRNLELLYDKMFESNLLKIIAPFSCVEIAHVAKLINLEERVVEKKLSQMILDHKLAGILDQGKGHLIVYETSGSDVAFTSGVEIIQHLGSSVEELLGRAKGLGKKRMEAAAAHSESGAAKKDASTKDGEGKRDAQASPAKKS